MPIVYIPEYINPFRFAEQHARLQGVVNIEDLKRLGLALNKQAGEVAVDVQFDIDEQGLVFLHGHIAIRNIIEDELILSLPVVPMHVPDNCEIKMPYKDADWSEEKKSPFHILKNTLKHKSSKK